MALDALFKLDPTGPTSNSNYAGANIAENCAPSGINNALRALGSFVAQQLCYQSAAISASVSTNIATTSTGLFMGITGPNAINSFGVVPGEQPSAAVIRFLQFSSSASLSHGGSILLQGGVSRRTQPGDIGGYIHSGSSDVWYEFLYRSADGALAASGNSISVTTITNRSMSTSAISTVTLNAASASITTIGITALNTLNSVSASVGSFTLLKVGGHGTIAQVVRDTDATYVTATTDLPCDNSIPQITEGEEVLSVAITPVNASSILRITAYLPLGASTAGQVGAALFVDATAGALNAIGQRVNSAAGMSPMVLRHTVAAASTSARTYRIRIGPDVGGPAEAYLNGDGTSRQFGGVCLASLEVEEILPQ
jgi:hypothetical protein